VTPHAPGEPHREGRDFIGVAAVVASQGRDFTSAVIMAGGPGVLAGARPEQTRCMAEMQRLLADLTELVDMVNAADSGPAALQRLVELAQQTVGGAGAVFAEYGPGGGRLVAASGACTPAIGREIDPQDVAGMLAQGRLIESAVGDLPVGLRAQTEASRMLGARVELAGRLVGSLHAYLAADTLATPLQRSAISLFSAIAVRIYQDGRGLPRYGAAPVEAYGQEQAWGLFATVTSHELRTPVTVIKGYADTLADHWDALGESGRRDVAQRLRQRSGELARLVERLLAAVGDGTVSTGEPVNAPFELNEALRAAVAELRADLRDPVRLSLPDPLPMALGERAGIATVLSELITNAVKYSPEGQEVEVTGLFDAATVGFRVADRGIGISAEHVERAFDRFWQADTGDRRRYGGVGLGLYLVRQIVGRQNGWVFLRPRERGGTVAEVRLRRVDV
jgi:signal transduction histidine kinase